LNINSIIHAYPQSILAMNEKFGVDLNPDNGSLFEKEIFNENSEAGILTAKLLYILRPDVKQVYEDLLEKSWYPPSEEYQRERLLKNEHDLEALFFKQWRDYKIQELRQKEQYETRIQQLMQQDEQKMNYIQAIEKDRDGKQAEIDWMKKTVFWKLRTIYKKIKSRIVFKER
jgi:hypothetical protein